MKTVAKLAIVTSALIGGSAMAFQSSMVDYPRNVAVEQPELAMTRGEVVADLVSNEARAHVNAIHYPAVYVDATTTAPALSRAEVNQELALVVGDHFRSGISTVESFQGLPSA